MLFYIVFSWLCKNIIGNKTINIDNEILKIFGLTFLKKNTNTCFAYFRAFIQATVKKDQLYHEETLRATFPKIKR